MPYDDQQILSGLGIITHPSHPTIGVNPGSNQSPYSTDLGTWMPCPFHQANTYNVDYSAVNTNGTQYIDLDGSSNPQPWLFMLEDGRDTADDYFAQQTITMIAPVKFSQFAAVLDGDGYAEANVGSFNMLRTMVTCGNPSFPNGSSVAQSTAGHDIHIGFGCFSGFLSGASGENLVNATLTFDPDTSKITMSATQEGRFGTWAECGHFNGYGTHITFIKTMDVTEDAFPSDYYGTYKILHLSDSGRSLVIDPDYKSIPGDQSQEISCIAIGDSWMVNHAGYNTLSTPFPAMEQSFDAYNTDATGGTTASYWNRTWAQTGYKAKSCFKRTDAITTMYMSFDGTRGPTYQSLTGRASTHRVRDVRYKTSTVINGVAVIGNVDTLDDIGQTFREKSRIMWSTPMAVDEFGFFRSKMIGSSDTGGIVALQSYAGKVICVKNNNTYILNPAASFSEEGRIIGAGADWESCVVRTPVGVAVANRNAIYIVPSKQEITLAIKKTYQGLTFNNPVMGYSGKHNELILIPDTSSAGTEMWIFNFNNKGWSKRTYATGVTYSNLLYSGDGSLLLVKQEETVGDEVVVNGTDFSSGWTTTGWTIAGGTATHSAGNTNALAGTGGTTVALRDYRITVETSADGTAVQECTVTMGAGTDSYTILGGTAHTHVFDLQSGSTVGTQLTFTPTSSYVGEIVNCSAKEVQKSQTVVKYSAGDTQRDNTKFTLHTKDFIFDEPNVSKYIKSFLITYKSNVESTVYIYINGTLDGQKTLPVNKSLSNRKININRECQSISFKIESDNTGTTDDDFTIEDITIEGWYNDKK